MNARAFNLHTDSWKEPVSWISSRVQHIPPPPGADPNVYPLAEEFVHFCAEMIASHLDATAGLQLVHDSIVNAQTQIIQQNKVQHPELANIEVADRLKLTHEFAADATHPQTQLHVGSMGEGKKRTAYRGRDALLLGNMLVSFLYNAWSHKYRHRFEQALGVEKLEADIFGELRQMRNAAEHNNFLANKKVASAKLLPWFQEGEEMFIPAEGGQQILMHIFSQLDKWCGITMTTAEAEGYIKAALDPDFAPHFTSEAPKDM